MRPPIAPAALLLLSATTLGARAQLWDTGPWDGVDGRSSDVTLDQSRVSTRAADDVLLPAGNGRVYQLRSLHGRMLARNYVSAFAEIYADAGGHPADQPVATLAQSSSEVLGRGIFGQFDLVDFGFDAPVTLAPGRYWVAVVGTVSGPPNDGYAYFGTAGNGIIRGLPAFFRVDAGPWLPAEQALGFPSDFSFTLTGRQRPLCDADVNGDGVADVQDFLSFLTFFSAADSRADLDGSGVINVQDLLAFLASFSAGC
jgi:hypothetical protein